MKTKAKILIVEDEAITAKVLGFTLEGLGYTALPAASTGKKALQLADKHEPDLVLMDIKLSGSMDGVETAEQIRKRFDIPVIYLTAYTDEKTLERAKITEPFGYLIKPFEDLELHTAIRMALYKHEAEVKVKESEERYRKITEAVTDYIYTVKVENGRTVETVHSEACVAVTGYTTKEYRANPYLWHNMVPEEDRDKVTEQGKKMLSEGTAPPLEHRIIHKDGHIRWVRSTLVPHAEEGRLVSYDGLISDITERKKAEKSLKIKNRSIESSINAIVIANLEGKLTYVNESFLKMWRYGSKKEVLGRRGVEFWESQEKAEGVFKILREKGCFVGEMKGKRKDGSTFAAQLSTSIVNDESGKPFRIMASFLDITEQKNAERMLIRYAADLKHANQLKETFTDIMRHDLLNPLNVVLTMGNLATDKRTSSKDREEAMEMVQRNAKKMERIIVNASELAKIESTEELEFQDLDLGVILRETITSIDPIAKRKGISIESKANGKHPAQANAIVWEVFDNLLSNAVKYSPKDSRVEVEIKDEDGNWGVSVKDRGGGVPDKYKKEIFERFARKRKGGVKGTGLGLAIARKVVEIHGGRIWVEDNPGGGSIFLVELPKRQGVKA